QLRRDERNEPGADLVAHAPEYRQGVFAVTGKGRILKDLVEGLPRARQDRTGFPCGVADRDDEIECKALQLLDGLATVRRDVDPRFGHNADRKGMHDGGPRSSRVHLDAIPEIVANPALAHLRPAR